MGLAARRVPAELIAEKNRDFKCGLVCQNSAGRESFSYRHCREETIATLRRHRDRVRPAPPASQTTRVHCPFRITGGGKVNWGGMTAAPYFPILTWVY